MRLTSTLFALGALLFWGSAPAAADQYDPALSELFDALQSGRGNPDTLEAEIENRWLSAPEAGTAILVERVVAALDQEEFAVAELLVEHLTELAPSFAEGYVLQGRLALARNDSRTAMVAFRRAVSLEPRHYVALERLGDIALARGDRERAYEYYRDALEQNPTLEALRARADRLRAELASQEI